jgi:hypothetical protein
MEKKDELRVKWEIGELGIILYLMGQIDKSLPSILHNIIWLHVCPLYQHTFPFIAHESLNGHPLSLVICHAYLMQWEEVIWAEIELLGFNNNWAIRKGEWNLKLRRKDYFSVPHYDKMFSSREQLSKTIAEEISLLFKFMTMSIYQFQYGQGVDEHSGKEKCVSIFIPNPYVGTLKELSKDVVSIRVGNSSNLIWIGCWLKQHNSRVIRAICDAIQSVANKQKDIAPIPFAFHITILSMKNEVNSFIILLEFLEEAPLDILITDQYSEPSYVTRVKLEMLIAVANESNTCELVTQLCEYANVNIPIARESIWVVGKMALQHYVYNVSIVVPLLRFHEMEKSYATSNAPMLATTIKSSAMVIPWDPGKFNTLMTKDAHQCCLRNSLSIYGLLNFVYDRGKVLAQKHLGANHVDLSVFNGSIFMCFSSKWMDHLAARRVIETFPNLEDKVVFKGVVLIETWIMRWTLFMGPNQSFGEFILEECRRMMRCQGWFMRCMTLSNYISNSM